MLKVSQSKQNRIPKYGGIMGVVVFIVNQPPLLLKNYLYYFCNIVFPQRIKSQGSGGFIWYALIKDAGQYVFKFLKIGSPLTMSGLVHCQHLQQFIFKKVTSDTSSDLFWCY